MTQLAQQPEKMMTWEQYKEKHYPHEESIRVGLIRNSYVAGQSSAKAHIERLEEVIRQKDEEIASLKRVLEYY